ncbi:MAG TPA: PAS domain S-box protein [Terriglobales bacterium]
MNRPLRVLIVEDSGDDTELLLRELKRGGYEPTHQRVDTPEAMRVAMRTHTWDLIIADYTLPGFSGPAALALMKELGTDLPFILVSGTINHPTAVAAMKAGAHDYVMKGDLARLTAAVERELNEAEVRRSHRGAKAALAESEECFRLLVEGVQDYAIFMLTPAGAVASWNAGAERIYRYRAEEILGLHVSVLYSVDDVRAGKPEEDLRLSESQGRFSEEAERMRRDGSRFWAQVITTAMRDKAGCLRGFARVTRDITERRRLEQEILAISEREQNRIGQDLHDGLCNHLAGVVFQGEFLEQKLSEQSVAEAAIAARMTVMLKQAITQAHGLARGLNPVNMEAGGLLAAFQGLCQDTEQLYKIACRLRCDTPVGIQDDVVATNLYRIAQEAVSNAIKHGKAKQILIELNANGNGTCLRVQDNGRGICAEAGSNGGLGLGTMRHRARLLGGTVEIEPYRSGGTMVTCLLPHRGNS